MNTVKLDWVKCKSGNTVDWCPLREVNLEGVDALGVYIIWHEGNPAHVVRLGQGDIAERLAKHRNDPAITSYERLGKLRVTWASAPSNQLDGIERYLADTWPPRVGDAFPNVRPIAVNSPW